MYMQLINDVYYKLTPVEDPDRIEKATNSDTETTEEHIKAVQDNYKSDYPGEEIDVYNAGEYEQMTRELEGYKIKDVKTTAGGYETDLKTYIDTAQIIWDQDQAGIIQVLEIVNINNFEDRSFAVVMLPQ